MYLALVSLLVALGLLLVARGLMKRSRGLALGGALVLVGTLGFFGLMSLWGELLWFEELGMARRFWTAVLGRIGVGAAAALATGAAVWLVTWPARRSSPGVRRVATGAVALVAGAWGALAWDVPVRSVLGVEAGVADPIFGRDVGFYLFTLPFIDFAIGLALLAAVGSVFTAAWSAVAPAALAALERIPSASAGGYASPRRLEGPGDDEEGAPASGPSERAPVEPLEGASWRRAIYVAVAFSALVLAVSAFVARYHLLYSHSGIVHGPGWTDVHVRLPAYWAIAGTLLLGGAALLVPRVTAAAERRAAAWTRRRGREPSARSVASAVVAAPALAVVAVWSVGLGLMPALLQWLRVTPNELALERPYLEKNIEFTRHAFAVDRTEVRQFDYRGVFSRELAERNDHLLSEVRLWDPRALDEVLEQFQEIRLYYEITSVDIDRYRIGDRYRQVMIAPREMEPENLPAESRTFVNRHFKYTHGYGLAMAPVSDFTADGLPRLVVRDLPPVSEHPSLSVTRPEIYYGERTNDFVVVNSRAAEFDFPSGAENVYSHYEGKGGVPIGSLLRRFVYGWKLGGTRLLFSEYPSADSRIMFRRNVRERVAAVAPFLSFDGDPYAVLSQGRIYWMIDAYTTSSYYPYSEPFSSMVGSEDSVRDVPTVRDAHAKAKSVGGGARSRGARVNYARNSVKAVVDAFDGSVSLYVFDPEDVVIRVWSRIYPELFRPAGAMPADLRAHVRYPEDFLHMQGQVYAKYHMTDPDVFYNQEDLWVRATEKHYGDIRVVVPYYVMWNPPAAEQAEFTIMQPYTPKHRQVLVGWIAGMCDGENYGRLLAYSFPKDQWILGPQQVDTKIDQDPKLSAQLTLWSQHGKRVIRGNVLAIPIGDTLLYVEPLYLQAEAAAYPELRMVVLMHGDTLTYAPKFDEALRALLEGRAPGEGPAAAAGPVDSEVLARAQRAFDDYARLTGEGRFEEAAAKLRELEWTLKGARRSLPAR